jgi:DNA repair protein RadC
LTTHKFVTIEQVVRAEQPAGTDIKSLFRLWGLTASTTEAMWVIALDNMEDVKTISEVARGGFHDVLVWPPVVLSAVLAANTDRFWIAHNHPSGPVTPTRQDLELTVSIMEAANTVGLAFEDHIICGPKGWFSFHDEGLLTRAKTTGLKAAMKGGSR